MWPVIPWCALRFRTTGDHDTQQRPAFLSFLGLRFFACEEDLSHNSPDAPLPDDVASGKEPFIVIGAIAGGQVVEKVRVRASASAVPSEMQNCDSAPERRNFREAGRPCGSRTPWTRRSILATKRHG